MIIGNRILLLLMYLPGFMCSCSQEENASIDMENVYPWCIVAFDSLERSPSQRIELLQELGFNKWAYDWDKDHLDNMEADLSQAQGNQIEIFSMWLWLNAKRYSLGRLSDMNENMFTILEKLELETRLWLSFSNNFFKDLSHDQALGLAVEMISFIHSKATEIGCKIELYNHGGWFGNPDNLIQIIEALPDLNLQLVYNFHHAHQDLEAYVDIIKKIAPHLASVNINGMRKEGPKILTVGAGDYEKDMVTLLKKNGFNGPWGILGHIKNEDVKVVLERNIAGLKAW